MVHEDKHGLGRVGYSIDSFGHISEDIWPGYIFWNNIYIYVYIYTYIYIYIFFEIIFFLGYLFEKMYEK